MHTQTLWNVEVTNCFGANIRSAIMNSDELSGYFRGLRAERSELFVVAEPMRGLAAWKRAEHSALAGLLRIVEDFERLEDRGENDPCPNCHDLDCPGCMPGYGSSTAELDALERLERWRESADYFSEDERQSRREARKV